MSKRYLKRYLKPNAWCPISNLAFLQYLLWRITPLSIQKCSIILNIFSSIFQTPSPVDFIGFLQSDHISPFQRNILTLSCHCFSLELWQLPANLFAYVHSSLFFNSFSIGQPQPSFQNPADHVTPLLKIIQWLPAALSKILNKADGCSMTRLCPPTF